MFFIKNKQNPPDKQQQQKPTEVLLKFNVVSKTKKEAFGTCCYYLSCLHCMLDGQAL